MNKTLGQKFKHLLDQPHKSTSQQNLPTISLNQLESKVNLFKKKLRQKENIQENVTNHKEINVCSPFYDRMKTHKENCKCPYHRKQLLTLIPVRSKNNSPTSKVHHLHRNTSYQKGDSALTKHRKYPFSKTPLPNKSPFAQLHLSQTQPMRLNHTSSSSHNCSYQQFMKDCDLYLLQKHGFVPGQKSNHIVRKGVKEIFEFINKHLDYSVSQMTSWIDSIQKDKDYGEFYVERFKEMKTNYERNKRKLNKKAASTSSSFNPLLNHTHKLNSEKLNLTHNFSKPKSSRYQKPSYQSPNSSALSIASSEPESSSESSRSSNDSQVSLQKIFSELKLKNKLSQKTSQRLINKSLYSFQELFDTLQINIINHKYPLELLQKLDHTLQSLIKRYSNNKTIQDINPKLQIISKTHQLLKKHPQLKSNSNLNKTFPLQNPTPKDFIDSERKTLLEITKNYNSLHKNSKRSSYIRSLDDSQTDPNDPFLAIQEDQNELDEDGPNKHKNSNNSHHPQTIRRSKLFNVDDFDPNHLRPSHASDSDATDRDFQRKRLQLQKGFLTKAEKYLFDLKMGKTIVNEEDSICTVKRKLRVINVLLEENPSSPEAQALKDYTHVLEHKVSLKTQIGKKKPKKTSQIQGISDEEIWKQISIDNLGLNLIFYNLTSKVSADDNEDLCILLNEIKINRMKKFQNHVTYKSNFKIDEEIEAKKKDPKKILIQDLFVQDGMGNMQFEPKIQHQSVNDLNETIRNAKRTITRRQGLNDLKELLKTVSIDGFCGQSLNLELDDMEEEELEENSEKIKKILKYAKINLPETFEKCLKSTSIYEASQMQSFISY